MAAFTIGKLSKTASVPLDTIRYYEKLGVLKPMARLPSGYRIYTEKSVWQLSFIRRAQELGFSLKDIGDLLSLSNGSSEACLQVAEKLQQRLADIDTKLRSLNEVRSHVQRDLVLCQKEIHRVNGHTPDSCPVLAELSVPLTRIRA